MYKLQQKGLSLVIEAALSVIFRLAVSTRDLLLFPYIS